MSCCYWLWKSVILVQNQKIWLLEKGRSVSFSYIYSKKEWYRKIRRGESKMRGYRILSTQYIHFIEENANSMYYLPRVWYNKTPCSPLCPNLRKNCYFRRHLMWLTWQKLDWRALLRYIIACPWPVSVHTLLAELSRVHLFFFRNECQREVANTTLMYRQLGSILLAYSRPHHSWQWISRLFAFFYKNANNHGTTVVVLPYRW